MKFTKNEFIYLLNELNDKLNKNDLVLTINIYGGFYLMLHDLRESTNDIDAFRISKNETEIEKYINKVALDNNIDNSWLNFGIKEIIYNDIKTEDIVDYINFSNIIIGLPSFEQIIAMKTLSGRSKDIEDIKTLLNKTNKITNIKEFKNNLYKFIDRETIKIINRNSKNRIGLLFNELESEYFNKIDWN